MEGEGEGAEQMAVSPRPRLLQRYGKGLNPYSTRGLDKFENVYAELSARRRYISNNTGAPEELVRFKDGNNGWVPVVVRAREGIWKNGVSILGPVENSNSDNHRELGRKVAITAFPRAVKPKNMVPHHHNTKTKKIKRFVAVDNRPNRHAETMKGSYRRTRQAMAYDAIVSATAIIITLFCLVFSGRLCAIFFTSAWWYLLPMLKGTRRINRRIKTGRWILNSEVVLNKMAVA